MMMDDALSHMVEKLVKNGKADKTLVVAQAEENLLTRFAVNRIHQHVRQETLNVTVVVEKDKKVGIAGTSSLKPEEADALLDKALQMPSFLPEKVHWSLLRQVSSSLI